MPESTEPTLRRKFDSHAHTVGPKTDYLAVLDEVGIQVALNLSYSGFRTQEEIEAYENGLRKDTESCRDRFAFASSFNVTRFQEPSYTAEVITKLGHDIREHGAVALKIWKDLGMMLTAPDGRYVFCDDERFIPIYDYASAQELVVVMHIADPVAAWRPLDPESPHFGYYSGHPEFHWYGQPEKPTHDELLDHRNAIIARYPNTAFVAAHLASLEHDLNLVGQFLDTYPNARVDIAGRMKDLKRMPNAQVRDFFIGYQDRVLYGTDWEVDNSTFAVDRNVKAEMTAAYVGRFQDDFAYFENTLELPDEVLGKFYYSNAASLFLKP